MTSHLDAGGDRAGFPACGVVGEPGRAVDYTVVDEIHYVNCEACKWMFHKVTEVARRGSAALSTRDPVLEIVRGIWRDLTGRGGLSLDNVDEETKAEMVRAWYAIVNRYFGMTTTLSPLDLLREVEKMV